MNQRQREEILDRWARGEKTSSIVATVRVHHASKIVETVVAARKSGDPRAIRHELGELCKKQRVRWKIFRRMQLGADRPARLDQIKSAIQNYDGPITQCPPGFHAGHRPKALREIGL